MAIEYDTATKNAVVDAMYAVWGDDSVIKIFTGGKPAGGCAAADTGMLLGTIDLTGDWMAAVSGGSAAFTTTYNFIASATGTAGYCRIYSTGGTTCRVQGNVNAGEGFTVSPAGLTSGNPGQLATGAISAG